MNTKEILDFVYDLAVDGQFENSDIIMKRLQNHEKFGAEIKTIVQAIYQLGCDVGYDAGFDDGVADTKQ